MVRWDDILPVCYRYLNNVLAACRTYMNTAFTPPRQRQQRRCAYRTTIPAVGPPSCLPLRLPSCCVFGP